MKVLFLFIDGVGLRDAATDNPVNPEVCPALCRLISAHSKPIDACLGVGGPPQSATGQGTMFTGVNCAAAMGKHCEGFPGPGLRKIIESDNLFLRLKARGKRVCFSDAYLVDSPDELAARRFKSVTTVMALTAPETIRTVDDLSCGRAVMQDLTRETIQDRWPDISVIPPQRAAEHLFAIARENDFTLYEFFQTDVSGHSMDARPLHGGGGHHARDDERPRQRGEHFGKRAHHKQGPVHRVRSEGEVPPRPRRIPRRRNPRDSGGL